MACSMIGVRCPWEEFNLMRINRPTLGAFVALGLAATSLTFASTANAAKPYRNGATIIISINNPAIQGTITIRGNGFAPGEQVVFNLVKSPPGLEDARHLGTLRANGKGITDLTGLTMPAGFTCANQIAATGEESGHVATADVTIGDGCGGSAATADADHGGAAAGFGIALLGAAFVGTGLAQAARRRRVDVDA